MNERFGFLMCGLLLVVAGCTGNSGPSDAEVLAIANDMAANTLVVITDPAGRDHDAPAISVLSVKNMEKSFEGNNSNTCIVQFDCEVQYLDAFKKAKGVSWHIVQTPSNVVKPPQLSAWFRTLSYIDCMETAVRIPVYAWDQQWYNQQRNAGRSIFTGIKIRMRKWDSGWKLENALFGPN